MYNPLNNEIFLPVPLKVAQRKDITDKAKLVYGFLLKTMGKTEYEDGFRIYISKIAEYLNIHRVKVSKYITELKDKLLIAIKRTGRASLYSFLPLDGDVTDAVTSDVTDAVTSSLFINKEPLKESDKRPAPDFFEKIKLWRSIPSEIRRQLSRKQIVKGSMEKIEYAIERMRYAIKNGGSPVRAFQNAFKGDHAKFTRKMEKQAIKEQEQHKTDIDTLIEEFRFFTGNQSDNDTEIMKRNSFKNFVQAKEKP